MVPTAEAASTRSAAADESGTVQALLFDVTFCMMLFSIDVRVDPSLTSTSAPHASAKVFEVTSAPSVWSRVRAAVARVKK